MHLVVDGDTRNPACYVCLGSQYKLVGIYAAFELGHIFSFLSSLAGWISLATTTTCPMEAKRKRARSLLEGIILGKYRQKLWFIRLEWNASIGYTCTSNKFLGSQWWLLRTRSQWGWDNCLMLSHFHCVSVWNVCVCVCVAYSKFILTSRNLSPFCTLILFHGWKHALHFQIMLFNVLFCKLWKPFNAFSFEEFLPMHHSFCIIKLYLEFKSYYIDSHFLVVLCVYYIFPVLPVASTVHGLAWLYNMFCKLICIYPILLLSM